MFLSSSIKLNVTIHGKLNAVRILFVSSILYSVCLFVKTKKSCYVIRRDAGGWFVI